MCRSSFYRTIFSWRAIKGMMRLLLVGQRGITSYILLLSRCKSFCRNCFYAYKCIYMMIPRKITQITYLWCIWRGALWGSIVPLLGTVDHRFKTLLTQFITKIEIRFSRIFQFLIFLLYREVYSPDIGNDDSTTSPSSNCISFFSQFITRGVQSGIRR